MEKKNPPKGYLLNTYELFGKVNASNSPSPLHLLDDPQKLDCGKDVLHAQHSHFQHVQLHSKVDLLSLEVNHIKKEVSPSELLAQFQQLLEYQLTATELKQIMDQSLSGGDLACCLLVQHFPELFSNVDFSHGCSACGFLAKQKLESLHLQLICNYVEVYYPSQCTQHINDEQEGLGLEGGSEGETPRDDCYDSSSLPDDLSMVKVEDSFEGKRLGRRFKIWLVPIDFDKLEIPQPDFKLFTHENLHKQYNCSGLLDKKQLDPAHIKLIHRYVQLLYPGTQKDCVWTLEFVGKMDVHCRHRDTERRHSYQQQCKIHVPGPKCRDLSSYAINPERFQEEFEGPSLPPERSSKYFCKIPLDELVVPSSDFPVASLYLLLDKENLQLQCNHSGTCNKKQLDPMQLHLTRHYVEAMYPMEKMEEVWHYECFPSINEQCLLPQQEKV
ncbi:BEN domain-containing protein 3 [Sciurus carolinensis]|uniref:BEN domain-containing protein 3 n=1 Tax=Sciurus carolinensis TaxID=30640 RepID=A0AA41SP71_SCICA|nr:BEN domain-containing protein 3 [Sciurus carolinensis]